MDPRTHQDLSDASKNALAEPVFAAPGDVVIFTEGLTHNAFPVLDNSRRRSLFFNWVPSIDRDVSVNDYCAPSLVSDCTAPDFGAQS